VSIAEVLFNNNNLLFPPPIVSTVEPPTSQSPIALLLFDIIIFGVAPNPCPIVAPSEPLAVQLTILNPLVVLADTVDVILPAVFDTPAPFANQFHEANVVPYYCFQHLSLQ
jgi:hypothetical protein